MIYRPYGKTNFDVSTFGIGAMRLPMKDGVVDQEHTTRMIRHAIDNGVNYIDTAYVYINDGGSERAIAKALTDGYRQKVKLGDKLPVWKVTKYEDMEPLLDESLKRLNTDHIEYYLLHALGLDQFKKMQEYDYKRFFEEMIKKGKIAHPCFSFHDEYEAFKYILDDYDWAMTQVQMNILDVNNQATVEGIKRAGKKGTAVVIMEPLRGGSLVNPPENVKALYDAFPVKRSSVEWAFHFLMSMPEVATILSGVSSFEQTADNIRIFSNPDLGKMTAEEAKLIEDVRAAYESRIRVGCTGCEYCMPCPYGVAIPRIFGSYDNASLFDNMAGFKRRYKEFEEKGCSQTKCEECGQCETACPQHIKIIDKLKEAHAAAK